MIVLMMTHICNRSCACIKKELTHVQKREKEEEEEEERTNKNNIIVTRILLSNYLKMITKTLKIKSEKVLHENTFFFWEI